MITNVNPDLYKNLKSFEFNLEQLPQKYDNLHSTITLSDSKFSTINNEFISNSTIYYSYSTIISSITKNIEIQNFIYNNDLINEISESLFRINDYFKNYEIKLELSQDQFNKSALFIYVFTKLSIKESSNILINMFKDWSLLLNNKFINNLKIINRKQK